MSQENNQILSLFKKYNNINHPNASLGIAGVAITSKCSESEVIELVNNCRYLEIKADKIYYKRK